MVGNDLVSVQVLSHGNPDYGDTARRLAPTAAANAARLLAPQQSHRSEGRNSGRPHAPRELHCHAQRGPLTAHYVLWSTPSWKRALPRPRCRPSFPSCSGRVCEQACDSETGNQAVRRMPSGSSGCPVRSRRGHRLVTDDPQQAVTERHRGDRSGSRLRRSAPLGATRQHQESPGWREFKSPSPTGPPGRIGTQDACGRSRGD
jgi:hypothetical protein